jgi:hypothetical protein
MYSSESRSEPKTPANMPSLRQLEFAFQTVAASLWDASGFAQRSGYKASDLETEARELLCSLGAKRIAKQLRIEWNARLKTAARCGTSLLICSRNLEKKADGGFHRTDPSGSRLVATWESQARSAVIPCRFRRNAVRRVSPTVARIAGATSLVCAKSNAQSPAWPVAAPKAAASSMCAFD